jgi:hypothetical protein
MASMTTNDPSISEVIDILVSDGTLNEAQILVGEDRFVARNDR